MRVYVLVIVTQRLKMKSVGSSSCRYQTDIITCYASVCLLVSRVPVRVSLCHECQCLSLGVTCVSVCLLVS